MIRWIVCVLAALASVVSLSAETPKASIEKFGNTPLVFEPNYGQTDASVRFLSRGDRYGLFLTETEAIVSLAGTSPAMVHMQLVGQNPHPSISGSGTQPGKSHYLKGADASNWQESVPHFLKVDYKQVYPGIDLTYYGNQRQLEYDFTVAPHVSAKTIELKFSGVEKVELGKNGDLILHTAAGEIRHEHPRVYQNRNGIEESVNGQFVLRGSGRVGFRIGAYDSSLPLVIDPKFVYSTYFGGNGPNGDVGIDIRVDAIGTTYVTGYTSSMDFFSTNLSTTAPGGGNLDGFVLKVDPSGSTILSTVYFGGSADDEGHRIALDSSGFVYISGYTTSADFPIVNGFQTKLGGRKDAYIMKLDNAVSTILFSSYLGGSLDEQVFGLSVDSSGNIYIAGETLSTNFPLVNPIRSRFGGGLADAFVAKVSPAGTVMYSTYLGGRGNDRAFDVTSDSDGNAYVVGFTSSFDFPITNAVYPTYLGGSEDAFLTKLNPDGSAYLISTYLGGTGIEEAVRVALDSGGNIIVAGFTSSTDFPIQNAFQPALAGANDIFVTKFTPDATASIFSTYIGSDGSESPPGLTVDSADNIYIAGFTSSFSFPVVNGINIGTSGGGLHGDRDAYVMKLNPIGSVQYSTYIGGSDSDGAVGIAVDARANVYVTGYSFSTDFPVVNAFQTASAGASDGILLKINADDVVVSTPVVVPTKSAVTLATAGASNGVGFAHATLEVPDGARRPAGMSILDLRQGGAEIGEAAFPLLPFITDGRVYINENGVQSTNLSIVNPSSDDITLYYFMADRTGTESNDGSVVIPAKSSFAQPVTGAPFNLPSGSSGTLTFSMTAPVAATAFRTYNESNNTILLTYLPIVDPFNFETRTTTIPQYASDLTWTSEFLLVNNTDFQMSGQVQFYNNGPGNGDPTQSSTPVTLLLDRGNFSSVPYNLAPHATDSFLTSGIEATVSGYAQIVPDPGTFTPVGTVILTYTNGTATTLHATVEAQIPATDFRLFTELSGDFADGEGHATAMAFAITNPSDSPTTITLTLVNMDGSPTGFATSFTLPAQGHIATYLHQLDAFQNMPKPFQGVLLVHATDPGIVIFGMRGRISENTNFVGTTTGPLKENPGSGTTVVFPHVLDGGGYATQFILFSDPSGTGTSGTLSFADENGQPLPLTLQLTPGTNVSNTVEALVIPDQGGTAIATAGVSNPVQSVIATVDLPDGADRPAGLAILELNRSDGEIGESAFPLLPFITDGRLLVNESSLQSTSLSIVNTSSDDVMLYYFLADNQGVRSAPGGFLIPANTSFMEPVTGPSFALPSDASGTLTFSTTAPIAATAFRTFTEANKRSLITYIPIDSAYAFETQTVTIPHFVSDQNWSSQFTLVNNTETQVSGQVQFYSNGSNSTMSAVPITVPLDSGNASSLRYSLAPLATETFSIASSPASITGFVQVVPDTGSFTPEASVILTRGNGIQNTIRETIESQVPGSDFRLFDELNGNFDGGEAHATSMALALTNPSNAPTTVTLTLVGMDGTPTGLSASLVLPPKGHIVSYLHQLAAFVSMPNPFQGILLMHASDSGITVAGMRVRIGEDGALVGTTTGPIKENAGNETQVVFPHILDGGGFDTQFILLSNSSGHGTSGTITFMNDAGLPVPLTTTK